MFYKVLASFSIISTHSLSMIEFCPPGEGNRFISRHGSAFVINGVCGWPGGSFGVRAFRQGTVAQQQVSAFVPQLLKYFFHGSVS
jgi:hypothetical protein